MKMFYLLLLIIVNNYWNFTNGTNINPIIHMDSMAFENNDDVNKTDKELTNHNKTVNKTTFLYKILYCFFMGFGVIMGHIIIDVMIIIIRLFDNNKGIKNTIERGQPNNSHDMLKNMDDNNQRVNNANTDLTSEKPPIIEVPIEIPPKVIEKQKKIIETIISSIKKREEEIEQKISIQSRENFSNQLVNIKFSLISMARNSLARELSINDLSMKTKNQIIENFIEEIIKIISIEIQQVIDKQNEITKKIRNIIQLIEKNIKQEIENILKSSDLYWYDIKLLLIKTATKKLEEELLINNLPTSITNLIKTQIITEIEQIIERENPIKKEVKKITNQMQQEIETIIISQRVLRYNVNDNTISKDSWLFLLKTVIKVSLSSILDKELLLLNHSTQIIQEIKEETEQEREKIITTTIEKQEKIAIDIKRIIYEEIIEEINTIIENNSIFDLLHWTTQPIFRNGRFLIKKQSFTSVLSIKEINTIEKNLKDMAVLKIDKKLSIYNLSTEQKQTIKQHIIKDIEQTIEQKFEDEKQRKPMETTETKELRMKGKISLDKTNIILMKKNFEE